MVDDQSRTDTYNQGERSLLTPAMKIKQILNTLNFDIKLPKLVKPPYV